MRFSVLVCLLFGKVIALPGDYHQQFDAASYVAEKVLRRDVAVIGAGATGTYGAIQLKDLGKSVIVVEKEETFGGHVSTYRDPNTGNDIEYGVQGYVKTPVSSAFFKRFNVETIPFDQGSAVPVYADFRTGQPVNVTLNFNLSGYAEQLNKYANPEYGWNLPQPVPEDLVLPFGDFVTKYGLEDIAYSLAFAAGGGEGNILKELTAYVFQRANNVLFDELATNSGIKTRNNSELYFKARAELGSNALLSSTVVAARRQGDQAHLVVQTPEGKKLVIASEVLVSCPIVLSNMQTFGLDRREHSIFSQFAYSGYYVILLQNTGLPANFSWQNAGADTLYNLPVLPGLYNINPIGQPGTFYAWYGSQGATPEAEIRAEVIRAVKMFAESDVDAEIVAFSSHTPYKQTVSADSIRNGFYDDLNGLQGYRNMWYTGNAFDNSGSSSLWNFTAQLVPRIIDAVDKKK